MLGLALLLACAGHADPAGPEVLQAEGVTLTLSGGSQVSAGVAQLDSSGSGQALDVVATDGALEIRAPRTEWDLRSRTAVLTGGVVAKRGPVELRCSKMVVVFSGPGRVERATATGKVQIRHGARTGTAETAVLTTADGRIELTGSPVLTDGANQMSGERIVLHMDADKVVCDGCRMMIAPGAVRPSKGGL